MCWILSESGRERRECPVKTRGEPIERCDNVRALPGRTRCERSIELNENKEKGPDVQQAMRQGGEKQ